MNKIVYTIAFLLLFFTMQSCEKNMEDAVKQVVIDTTLVSGTEYMLNLQQFGDADDVAAITKQGNNYTTSAIINTTGAFNPVYHYSAVTKTGLSDQVLLTVSEGHEGRGHGKSTIITINFIVK
jgi:hypothetical protein